MGWEDRHYNREDGRSRMGNPLMWILTGSLPLFTAFGIRVRAHASLVLYIGLTLIFGLGKGFTWQDAVQSMAALFIIVLLHEFGHCFAARWVGGDAEDILMHPLGGLAFARPPHRPLPSFITTAGGPAVNVLICLICAVVLYFSGDHVSLNPFKFSPGDGFDSWFDVYRYAFWIFEISWMLLIFNLLPIFPLDGGRMLQEILWPKFGYYKSMLFASTTGMVGAVIGAMVALASRNIGLAVLAVFGFLHCKSMREQVLAAGPYGMEAEPDYSSSIYANDKPRRRKLNNRSIKRAQKAERMERIEQRKIDAILAKVSAQGMQTLTWWEKRTLRKATERQRQADMARRS